MDKKYRPQLLEEMTFNKTAKILQHLSLETVPHLIIHGKTGTGKRTLVYAFINHLFGKVPKAHHRTVEIETFSKQKINISYVEANEYIEICPSDYNFKDKDVMQIMIKNIAETKPIMSLISKKNPKLKLVIVTQAEKLTKDAQAALRRTVETYSKNFRIILLCSDMNYIIDPIKSRALCLGIECVSEDVLFQELKSICENEKLEIGDEILHQISKDSENNMRRALFFLEKIIRKSASSENSKRQKAQLKFRLEWEEIVDEIVNKIKSSQTINTIIDIRSKLNKLLVDCIPPKNILKRIFKNIMENINEDQLQELSSLTAKYDGRLELGAKSIFHLEAYILSIVTHIRMK